ncbi:TlpA family protein disulfide reductase [Kibdelosporangium aridum]|uniref:Thiol-disulfide isomerase or thioredoxin n=1 Tax=Kibdelosporangium aridum TaxID=2030 RepID=A0A1Y5X8C5_KIBAR|nr:TlpA disulfide reductase family protein [Kibdelosporangium aridum]SMC74926.1 Thiol-disulfide isomerase or thioredoxin [Kibdelosporangium aridum]
MPLLTAAVVIVGILCVIDLLLSFGIIRRLREQNETLRKVQQQAGGGIDADIALPAGSTVAMFTATAVSGAEVSNLDGTGFLIGFFTPNCEPCKERMPEFIEYATRFDGRVIAVADVDPGAADDMVGRLGEVAEVVLERDGGPVHQALGAKGYPALSLVDGSGTVVASGWEISALPVPANR